MYEEVIDSISEGALKKYNLYKSSKLKYIMGSAIAGFQIGIGALAMGLSISVFKEVGFGLEKITNGLIFSLALSLVMMAGGELFTGNVLVMCIGSLKNKLSKAEAIKITCLSYFGNLIGSVLIALIYIGTGAKDGKIVKALFDLSMTKVSYDVFPILFKGIMCNVLVCLAVFCCFKMKTEIGKLVMIIWCILPFVGLGFEHSVANMSIFSIGLLFSRELTLGMIVYNLIPCTIGNIIGGLMVALGYYYMTDRK